MTGSLTIVGLGPGNVDLATPAASRALAEATDLVGYATYLARVPQGAQAQKRHASDNRVEIARARHALALAAEGRRVTVVSGGDPGVFGMAAAVFEAIESGEPAWREIDIRVEPGVTAMLAAAAAAGAPLGGDFCAISLSDNLKPWASIECRLTAAARAGFVIALYNPRSRARPRQLAKAFVILGRHLAGETVVLMVKAAGTSDAQVIVTSLEGANAELADMRTIVIIGAQRTRVIDRGGRPPWVYTPRSEVETS